MPGVNVIKVSSSERVRIDYQHTGFTTLCRSVYFRFLCFLFDLRINMFSPYIKIVSKVTLSKIITMELFVLEKH